MLEPTLRVLVIGCNGSMGRRYIAILKYLNIICYGVDVGDKWPKDYTNVIIATPTSTHYELCKHLINEGKSILCEKPVSLDIIDCEQLRDLASGRHLNPKMVCNWCFAGPVHYTPNSHNVVYDFYNTGKDGLLWDCIQLVYLQRGVGFSIKKESPIFKASIDGVSISLTDIERSYIRMIHTWIMEPSRLWDLTDAMWATKKAKEMLCLQ